MYKAKLKTGLFSLSARKKQGFPNLCGGSICAWTECGVNLPSAGIYRIWRRFSKKKQQRMDFYDYNLNPAPSTLANRLRFGNAVRAWQALSDPDKKVYNDRAKPLNKYGNNLFITEYIKTH